MFTKICLLNFHLHILSKYIPENTFLVNVGLGLYYGILSSCLKKKIPGLLEFFRFFRYIIDLLKKQNKKKRKQKTEQTKQKTEQTKQNMIVKGTNGRQKTL